MKAAIYARVSTQGQAASLETQIELCRRAAAKLPLHSGNSKFFTIPSVPFVGKSVIHV